MRKIVIASKNRDKIREIREILTGLPVQLLSLFDFPHLEQAEEEAESFLENACLKARAAARATGLWALADDSGLEVEALDGRPGVRSARFAGAEGDDEENNRKLLAMLAGVEYNRRRARYRCVMALAGPEGMFLTTEGTVEGFILSAYRGCGGFGYDPLFYYPPFGKTFAEVTPAEKNSVSHRGVALRQLGVKLAQFLCTGAKAKSVDGTEGHDKCKRGV